MILRIDEADLRAELYAHQGQINTRPWYDGFADAVAGIFYVFTAFASGFSTCLQVVAAVIGIIFTFYGIRKWVEAIKHRYTVEQLYEGIKNVDRTEIRSSIIAVRDATVAYSNRYLLYYDQGWDCWFFPNHKTADLATSDKRQMSAYLSNQFEIPDSDFELKLVSERDSKKPSTEHGGEERYYEYHLYVANVTSIPVAWKSDSFQVGAKRCRWMSIDEMLNDSRINEVNHDVVAMVRDSL
ncbi:DUF1206 domain-containing protein [Bifidobacterium moukalabense]|uniref:DUF1206 domain-containing protein n=1 Tax=Bifidobacterium moukalabense TaxID=1333651 RepID=UPI001FCF0B72|nr:DUF1206 domain-containing protein [Bifidobacterium moukalabense]